MRIREYLRPACLRWVWGDGLIVLPGGAAERGNGVSRTAPGTRARVVSGTQGAVAPHGAPADEGRRAERAIVGFSAAPRKAAPRVPVRHGEGRKGHLTGLGGLAALSLDALSSVAHGPEAMLLVLAAVGPSALHLSLPIALAIAGLLAVLAVSYCQVIAVHPDGGGGQRRADPRRSRLPEMGCAPVAAHVLPQLGDPCGSRGGHDHGTGDGGEQYRHGQRHVQVRAEEVDADGARVL